MGSICFARLSSRSAAVSSSTTLRIPMVAPSFRPGGSLPVDGDDLAPPGLFCHPYPGQELAFHRDDLVRVQAVQVQRVVQEGVGLTADGRPDFLVLALHVQATVGKPAA